MPVKNRATFKRVFTRSYAASYLTGTIKVANIQGPILVWALGVEVKVAIPSGANTLKFTMKSATAGTATDICGATDTASAAKEQLFIVDGVVATNLVKSTAVSVLGGAQTMHQPTMLADGTLEMIFSAGPPATGQLKVFMLWEPLAIDSYIAGEGA